MPMKLLAGPAAALAFAMLAGCGGGGTSPVVPQISQGGSPPPVANTTLSAYLPLGRGNVWAFSNRSRMVDAGTFRLNCTCPYPHGLMEEIDVFDSTGNFGGSLFFSKQLLSSGTIWTTLLGVRTPGSNLIALLYDSTLAQGLPVMDDAPFSGETWAIVNGPRLDAVSTIVSVGGTVPIGSHVLVNVAQTRIDDPVLGKTAFLSFAQGTGFSQVAIGPLSAGLASFSVDVSRGGVPLATATVPLPGRLQHADVVSVLSRVLF